MTIKIMMIVAGIILTMRFVKSADKGTTPGMVCNGFLLMTMCLISRMYF